MGGQGGDEDCRADDGGTTSSLDAAWLRPMVSMRDFDAVGRHVHDEHHDMRPPDGGLAEETTKGQIRLGVRAPFGLDNELFGVYFCGGNWL